MKKLLCATILTAALLGGCGQPSVPPSPTASATPKASKTPIAKPTPAKKMTAVEAARTGDLETLKATVAAGAYLTNSDKDGWSVLHVAADSGNKDMTLYLLLEGVRSNTNNDRKKPDELAEAKGHKEVAQLIRDRDALLKAVSKGDLKIVKEVIGHNPDLLPAKNQGEQSPLWTACREGHDKVAAFLIEQGADLKESDRKGATLLHWAAWSSRGDSKEKLDGKKAIIKLLLAKGFDVNVKSEEQKETPLFQVNDKGITELLIANGADVNAKNYIGWVPLYRAGLGDIDGVRQLLLKTTDAKTLTDNGDTLLFAVRHPEDAKILIAKGADPKAKNKDGSTALHGAAAHGHTEFVKLLIAEGVEINAKAEKSESTALHYAASNSYGDVVKLLVAKGADVNAKDKKGRTPLSRTGNKDIQALLKKSGGTE